MVLQKIGNSQSLTDRAYQSVKDAIINNYIKPGEKLVEEDLTKMLGVSRTTVRSALQKLSYERWVQVIPGVGYVVAILESQDAKNLFVVRRPLELLAIELAIEMANDEELLEIETVFHKQKKLHLAGDFMGVIEQNLEFHDNIARSTKNDWLREILFSLNSQLQRFFILSQNMEKRSPNIIREHESIINALKNRDKEYAKEIISSHVIWKEEV